MQENEDTSNSTTLSEKDRLRIAVAHLVDDEIDIVIDRVSSLLASPSA